MKMILRSASETSRSGGVSAYVAAAILLVLAVVAYYQFSDPGRAMIDDAIESVADWTPENIRQEPERYLNACEREAKMALEKGEASRIEIKTSRVGLMQVREKAEKEQVAVAGALEKFKEAYRESSASGEWPVSVLGSTFTEARLKQQIVASDREVKMKTGVVSKCDAGLQRLDMAMMRLGENRAKVEQQLAEITANRELLKVNALTEDLDAQLSEIGIAVSVLVDTTANTESLLTAEDILADQPVVDDAEFASIMAWA